MGRRKNFSPVQPSTLFTSMFHSFTADALGGWKLEGGCETMGLEKRPEASNGDTRGYSESFVVSGVVNTDSIFRSYTGC